jgi:hypothetical protein
MYKSLRMTAALSVAVYAIAQPANAQPVPSCTRFLADVRDDRDLSAYVDYIGMRVAQYNSVDVSRGCKSGIPWNLTRQNFINMAVQQTYASCMTWNGQGDISKGAAAIYTSFRKQIKDDTCK